MKIRENMSVGRDVAIRRQKRRSTKGTHWLRLTISRLPTAYRRMIDLIFFPIACHAIHYMRHITHIHTHSQILYRHELAARRTESYTVPAARLSATLYRRRCRRRRHSDAPTMLPPLRKFVISWRWDINRMCQISESLSRPCNVYSSTEADEWLRYTSIFMQYNMTRVVVALTRTLTPH